MNFRSISLAVLLFVPFGIAAASDIEAKTAAPWRLYDEVLLEFCFDKLEVPAPDRLVVRTVTDVSMGGASMPLVSRTMTDRPIYQASLRHPVEFPAVLVKLPGTDIWAKISDPKDLSKRLDMWMDLPVTQCTADQDAADKILFKREMGMTQCPDVGLRALMKVANRFEYAMTIRDLRDRGVGKSNGLRGCREFVHPLRK